MKIVFSSVLGISYCMTRGAMNEKSPFVFCFHRKKPKFLCTAPVILFIPQKIQQAVSLGSTHGILIKMSKQNKTKQNN